MLVVSRKPSESVVVENEAGLEVTVTVVHVGPRRVTLKIDLDNAQASVEGVEMVTARSEVIPLGECGEMTVVDVRGGLVRLGFELPKGAELHRKESYESQSAPRGGPAVAATGRSVVAAVDQCITIGTSVTITPTDVDPGGVRVLVRGELVGGADDGLRIDEARELRIGSPLQLGPLLTVTLANVAGPRARFLVNAPPHMNVTTR